jgi:Fe-S oxidoreductase
MRPSLAEVLILAVLICASGSAFWFRFRKVVLAIRAAKPERSWSLSPLVPRVGRFIWEVLLQGKVIFDRPAPGLAHAFVFWGFCAFALVTVNHIAAGFDTTLISRESLAGRVYFGFVAVFAVAVAVSIAGLAVRRFVARPVWLGTVSAESGVIALLILLLMVTYLATFWFAEGTVGGRINWWLHTITLLSFLPLIPHTKHLHLLLSPVTIFARRNGFSKIPPLAGDEDFGLDTGKDVTKLIALQAYTCVECGRCTEFCPAYNTGKVLNPKEIILGVRSYLDEHGPRSDEALLAKHISSEAAFQCTTCGGCEYSCPVGIQHLPIIIGLRRGAVNTGKWEDEYGTKLFLTLERNGNSLGFPSSERQKFIEKHALPIYDGSQEYCLWLGCMGAYDPHGREIILALVRVMQHLGISFGVLRKEKCNGDPIRRLGNDYLFSQLAEPNIEHLKESSVKKLVSICPHCVRTIGEDWKEFGASFQIEHHSELMARNKDRLPSANGERETVVYHDPCYLGRYRNIYDEPRAVIGRFADQTDPPRARERSFCCGAGGGQMFLGEEKGKRVNMARAEELAATGAATVGVACPFCQSMFRDALAAVSEKPPKLMDIAQIAAAAIRD